MEQFSISIICCTHNRLDNIKNHFQRLIKIIPPDVEVLYILDHCTDGTLKYLKDASKDEKNIRIIENGNSIGRYAANNYALNFVKGTYVNILDDDDSVSDNFYHVLSKIARGDDSFDIIVTELIVNKDGRREQKIVIDKEAIDLVKCEFGWLIEGDVFEHILRGRITIVAGHTLINVKILHKYRYHAELKKTADWLLWRELSLKEKLRLLYVPEVYGIYNITADSMSVALDKPYWNMRASGIFYNMVPKNHRYYADIKKSYSYYLLNWAEANKNKNLLIWAYYYVKSLYFGHSFIDMVHIVKNMLGNKGIGLKK